MNKRKIKIVMLNICNIFARSENCAKPVGESFFLSMSTLIKNVFLIILNFEFEL